MCIIAYIPSGIKIDKKEMENCFDNNPDGAGFMYQDKKHHQVVTKKGYMTFEELWPNIKKLPWNVDRVIHFRIATSGSVDKGCCHPFPLCDDYKEMRRSTNNSKVAIAHNGIISWTEPKDKLKSIYSDTMAFIANYMYPMKDQLFKTEMGDIITHATNGGRFAIMSPQKTIIIGNFEMSKDTNIFYSNGNYQQDNYQQFDYSYYYSDKYKNKINSYKNSYLLPEKTESKFTSYKICVCVSKEVSWDIADMIVEELEFEGNFVDDYYVKKSSVVITLACLPIDDEILGYKWYMVGDDI